MPTFPSTLFPLRRRADRHRRRTHPERRDRRAAVLQRPARLLAGIGDDAHAHFPCRVGPSVRHADPAARRGRAAGGPVRARRRPAGPLRGRRLPALHQPAAGSRHRRVHLGQARRGRSAGNWLDQSMQDRAAEAMAAYLRVRSEPGVDAAKVGFLGYSQAGWVLPIVASRAQPAFTVIIGGAVNWRDQGAYYTRKRLQAQGVAADEIERRLAAERTQRRAVRRTTSAGGCAGGAARHDSGARPLRATQLSVGCVRLDPENARPGAGRVGRDGPNVDAAVNAARYRLLFADAPDKRVMLVPDAGHVCCARRNSTTRSPATGRSGKSCASCCWAAKPTCSLPCATSPTGSGRPPPAIEDGPPCRRSNRFSADMEWPYHGRNFTRAGAHAMATDLRSTTCCSTPTAPPSRHRAAMPSGRSRRTSSTPTARLAGVGI